LNTSDPDYFLAFLSNFSCPGGTPACVPCLRRSGFAQAGETLHFGVQALNLVYCVIDSFTIIVIPAKAGIQKNRHWMPHQVRHDTSTKRKEALDALHSHGTGQARMMKMIAKNELHES
jgi:hypothetical protein